MILISLIVFISCLVQAIFGFGSALIAMPLLSMIIGLKLTAPVVCFMSTIISVFFTLKTWRQMDFGAIKGLLLGALFGIPLGAYAIYKYGEDPMIKNILMLVLGFVLVGFGVYQLCKPKLIEIKTNFLAGPIGFIAGILGGAYNTNGPPLVIYGALKRWDPDKFRSTTQTFFVFCNFYIIGNHIWFNNITGEVLEITLNSLPAILIAIIAGVMINKRISPQKFAHLVHYLIIITGLVLFINSILSLKASL